MKNRGAIGVGVVLLAILLLAWVFGLWTATQ